MLGETEARGRDSSPVGGGGAEDFQSLRVDL